EIQVSLEFRRVLFRSQKTSSIGNIQPGVTFYASATPLLWRGSNMSVAELVATHLPYLRRFARAVTGSQKSGDAYVASTLEAMLVDPSIFPDDLPPRMALYQTFLKLVNS